MMLTSRAPKIGTLRRWQSPALAGFEICYCEAVSFLGAQRHVFDAFTITLVEDGAGSFTRGPRTVRTADSHGITVSSPGDVIAADSGNGTYTCRNLYLTSAFLDGLSEDLGRSRVYTPTFASMQPGDQHSHRALLRATNALAQLGTDLERQEQLLPALRQFVTGLAPEHERPAGRERRATRRVREMLIDRLDENLSLDELAAVSGLNKFHLLRVFRAEMGLPPHAYQMHARVGRARALMARGATVFDAGVDTGFTDAAHFRKVFKRIVGLTPGRYRDNVSGQEVNFVPRPRRATPL
jgi:AraC-like DNA-binding protein